MNVDFPDDFNPVWHTCDSFVDGGDDAFIIDCLCDEYYEALEEMRGGRRVPAKMEKRAVYGLHPERGERPMRIILITQGSWRSPDEHLR